MHGVDSVEEKLEIVKELECDHESSKPSVRIMESSPILTHQAAIAMRK
jgi:hypothetical protein